MPNFFTGIILDMQSMTAIDFKSFDPPSMSRNAIYDDVSIRGRSEPHVFYSNTDPQIWRFTIKLTSSIDEFDGKNHIIAKEKANFLESLVMPDYGDAPGMNVGIVKPPHLVRVFILKLLDVVGTLRNLSLTYPPPYDALVTGYSQFVDASFDIQAQRTLDSNPYGFSEIRKLVKIGQTWQS